MEIKKLVLSGGGIKGLCYVGLIRYLEKQDLINGIDDFYGSSIGSFFCFLINISFSSYEIKRMIKKLKPKDIIEIDIFNFMENFSIDSGRKLEKNIYKFMKYKGIDKNITLKELHDKTNKTLNIIITNIDQNKAEIFNKDTHPNCKVSHALRMSMNIPLLWKKTIYNDNYYVDGGISNNFPIEFIKDIELYKKNILGVVLSTIEEQTTKRDSENTSEFLNYVKKIIKNILSLSTKEKALKLKENGFNILILKSNLKTTDFGILKDYKQVSDIIKNAYTETKNNFIF